MPEIVKNILMLLAGVGVFIAGMNMLSKELEKSAGGGLKKILSKITGNRFAGVGVGAGVTAIIQSSSATSVMAIGFVNAGVMTLFQATSVILGANIGTTITGIIVSLKSLPIGEFASALAFVGVMMTFFKKDTVKQIGGILCGFGLIFVGLDIMSTALSGQEIKDFFIDLFQHINFPLVLTLCGVVFTAIIQSSSAATGIFITMVGTGALGLNDALFLVLGANIGTCATALIACLGAGTNAKRTAFIHVSVKTFGAILFMLVIWPLQDKVVWLLQKIPSPEMQLAWFHVVFNVLTTLVMLPFIKQLVWLAEKVVREKKVASEERHLKFVDERLLKTPSVALMQVKQEVNYMASLARENLEKSFAAMKADGAKIFKDIAEKEEIIDFTNKALTKYLISLSPLVDRHDEKIIGAYFHVLNDLERVGDHAENFGEIGMQLQDKSIAFSEGAQAELAEMEKKVLKMFDIALSAISKGDAAHLDELTVLENEVDSLKRELSSKHYARLAEGKCKIDLSPYFTSTVAGLERVADHLVNVGYSILNPTGSQSEAKKEKAKA